MIDSPLRKARLERGWSLRDVQRLSGFNYVYLWELETGKYWNPSLENCRKLTRLYGKSIDELFPDVDGSEIRASDTLFLGERVTV